MCALLQLGMCLCFVLKCVTEHDTVNHLTVASQCRCRHVIVKSFCFVFVFFFGSDLYLNR